VDEGAIGERAPSGYEINLNYYDGTSRRTRITDIETPFPPGELIVSQTDAAGIITMCNPAFIHMSGYSAEELLGAPHYILRHPDMPRVAFTDLWTTITAGHRWSGYVKNLRKDGGFYWVFATILPTIRNSQVIGYTSVRREPARRRVDSAAALYARLLSEEVAADSDSLSAPASGRSDSEAADPASSPIPIPSSAESVDERSSTVARARRLVSGVRGGRR
jgi:PAS domain S-box-containing protein